MKYISPLQFSILENSQQCYRQDKYKLYIILITTLYFNLQLPKITKYRINQHLSTIDETFRSVFTEWNG